ncbi:unnamed protein product, partial [Symbiodinium microadriaticum]
MNVSGSGMLSVYELEAALEAAGAKCHVSEAWVKETFHQLSTLIQDAGLNIKSVFPPGLVVEKEFRDVALRFLTQLRPSQLDRLWKYLQATCADDAVQVRHAGGDRDRLPSDSVVAVVFGPTLTSSPNELSSPGLQGAGAAGYYGPAGGVRAVGAAARPTSRRRWTPGTTCALQASQVNSDFSDFSVFFLTPGVPDRKVSPDVCFDTLSPFITAEHFQELGLHYDPVKAKQVFKLIDSDRDSKITRLEFRLMFKALAPDSHTLTTRESLEDDFEKEEQHQVQRLQNRVLLLQREVQELRGPSERGHLEPTVPEKQFQQLSQAHGKVANHLQALRAQLQTVGANGRYSHVLQHHLTAHWTSKKMEVEYRTRYLPFEIRGAGVLVKEDERHFRIDNSKLGESAQGVCYRLSKDASDKDFEHVAFWNSIVAGKDTGDGWLLCDLDSENLELLDQLDRETPLETLSSKFFRSCMVCCSTSSNIDGRWISNVFPGQKTIRGALVNDGAVTRPLTWDGLNAFSVIVAGEKRRARLVDDRLLWHDGELWTRDHRDMDVVKPTEKLGKDLETTNAKFQCVCQKGLKPGSSNQDAWSLLRVENEFTLYTVCDGHGPHGHDVANFVKNNLPRVLIKDPRFNGTGSFGCMGPVFLDAFRLCHMLIDTADSFGKLDALWSGTTATTILHNHQTGQLLLAHAGDSSAVVGSQSGKEVRARQLTRDHKPSLCDERDRIVAWGGRIEFDGFADYRVYDKDGYGAGLNMTRSLGDLNSHCDCGLIADPELGEYAVTAEDQVLLLCSDGIWEFVSPQEAVELVLKQSDAASARALVDEARRRWSERADYIDDIVALVVYLSAEHDRPVCAACASGGTDSDCANDADFQSKRLATDFLVWIWELQTRQGMCDRARSDFVRLRGAHEWHAFGDFLGTSIFKEPDSDEAQTPAKKPEVLLCEQLLVSERKAVEDLPVPTVEELYGHVQLILAKLQKALLRNPAMKKGHVQELLKKSGDVVIDGRWKVKSILSYSKRMVVALCQDLHVGSEVIVKMSQTLEASLQLAHVDYVLRMLANVPIVPQVQYCSSPSSSLPFLVMELLQGSTLDVRFQETEAMLELEAAEIGHALLMGMDACHQRQVFNLALCPENVWVGPPLEGSRVRILDWSISETGAAVVENPKLYAYINMRKTGLLRGKNGPTLMSGGQEVSPSEIASKRDRKGLLQKLVFNGHGSLYYMSMEQLYQTIRSFGRAGSPATVSQSWFQESIGSVVKVEGRTVHWFQKGDGFVQTNQPVTVTPLGQLFEVEVIKAVNLGRKLDCELGFCIGLCSKPPRASEKSKTERQDCWIAGGDTSFYLKGVQRRVGKSSADGQQKYLHIGSDLHAKDRVAILAEWSGALSLFVNGEQVGRYSNAIDHSEVVLPLYGVADIFVREASEDYTVRSIGLIGDESEDGWTVQKEQMERAAVELAGIHQLLHGEAAVATTIGPSCDLYACGRILLSLFRGGREVLPSSNLDRFAVAYANWAQAGCPPTEKRYGLLWALKELKGEKTERSEELAQLEKTEVRLVVSRCIKRSRYSRLGSCWEAAEMLASASSWLSISDDFMKSHLDAVQQDVKSKRYHLLQTHGDSFVGSFEASPASVLWGELFTEKERNFLRHVLEEGNQSFGVRDTFQLDYRIAWNPTAKQQMQARGEIHDGKLVILIHGYSGRITDSWGWAKLVKPLWKQGFTVCLLDMPGFGRSSINLKWNAPLTSWQHVDSIVLSKFVEGMRFRSPVSFIGYRESCKTVLRLFRDSPHLVATQHALIDPIFTLDDVYPLEPPYGAISKEWLAEKPGKQAVEFDKFLGRSKTFLWTIFTGKSDTDSGREALQAVMRRRQHLSMRICVSHVTKEFISEARAGASGASSYAHVLFFCKYMKDKLSEFMAGGKAPKEIPPWALEVTSTTASSSIGSKSLPSVDSPAGRAKAFSALETVQEVAEVLSRCTTARQDSRPQSPVATKEASDGAPLHMEKHQKPAVGAGKSRPLLPALYANSTGFRDTVSLRETLRTDAAGSKGFRDRPAHALTKQKHRSEAALGMGMSRFGSSLLGQTRSEPKLQDLHGRRHEALEEGPGQAKKGRGHKGRSVQRTAGGVAICRAELPPPPFKTEAVKCSITSCASKATEQRLEDPQPIRHRLICPVKRTKEAVEATGYSYSPRGAQVIHDWPQGRSIQAVAVARFQPTLDEELQESLLSCFSLDLQPQHQTQSAKPKRRRMLRHSVCNVHLGDATQPSLFLEDVRLPTEELPRSVFPLEEILSRNILWLVAQMVRKLDLTPAPPGLGQEKPPSVGGTPGAVETLVAGMARSTILVSLSLRSSCLRDQGVFQLAAAVAKCQTLRELDLSDNNFGAKGAAKVLQSGKEHLEMLDLCRNRLGDAGAKALAEVLLNCHSISVLRLRANGIGDEGGEALAESLMSVTSLREFDFSQNEIHLPTSSVMLRAVCASRGLQRLYLDSSLPWPTSDSFEVQVAGFTDQLSGAQAVPSLQFLSLRRCGLSTSACKLFQSLASNSTLRQLNVSCNGLRQSVAPAIAAALTSASTGLEELDLRDNRLGAQDALAVALEQVYAAAAQALQVR